jgi:glycosyltransferase involved in cell wall biosynthesis
VIPAIENLKKKGYDLDIKIADASVSRQTYLTMPQFYREIDVLICASISEGTPTPVLEAAAMGKTWISTNVGVIPELAINTQSQFIFKRGIAELEEKIALAYNNRDLLQKCSSENRYNIEVNWTSRQSTNRIFNFFRSSIAAFENKYVPAENRRLYFTHE